MSVDTNAHILTVFVYRLKREIWKEKTKRGDRLWNIIFYEKKNSLWGFNIR
jgi:hypothetical protein